MTTTIPYDVNGHKSGYTPLTTHTVPDGAWLPEAACSVNLFFEIDVRYGKAQATGRGATPAEAARNLHETIEATRQALAPQLPTREEALAALLAKGLAKAVSKEDWGLCERLSKSAALLLSGAVQPTDSPAITAVRSATHPDTWYEVAGTVCSCKNSVQHVQAGDSHYLCKHALAVLLARKIDKAVPF